MNRRTFKKIILILSFLSPILWAGHEAFPSPPHFNYDIQSHSLKIRIDPPSHILKAEDQIEILWKEETSQILSFLLHSRLKITRLLNLKTGKPLPWKEVFYSEKVKRLDVSFRKGDSTLSLSISYEGPIYDPVVKERTLQFIKGDQTSGLIGSEGVYLSPSSRWYPDRPDSMALFKIEATIPEPFRLITQGELLSDELKDGLWKSQWVNEWPTENLSLVAGKYSVRTRKIAGIKISTYFFPEDDRFSEVFIKATEEYLKIYPDLLGPYPYKKFDIVQNFFSSGYSFPTFTLLAPEAIRQGKEFLRPGALDHEIVHSWWGHYVSGKPGMGNWSEALTTYCTNYLYKELKMGEDVARKHRLDVMQKYAVQVPPIRDYPLRQFEGKEGEIDGQIGYGKGSMVFHMLRQVIGKGLFFNTLKNFSRKYGGQQASWEDLKKAFEEASAKRLDRFFSQWLDRPGGPRLKLENVTYQVTSKGYLIAAEVVQEEEVYELPLTIEIDEGNEKENFFLEISKQRTPFSITVAKLPLSITIDPQSHIFRRLYSEEITPCLNAFLEDPEAFSPPPSPSPIQGGEEKWASPLDGEGRERGKFPQKIFVIPDRGDEEMRKTYIELAKMAKERKGGEILSEREMTDEKILSSSLMLLGESWKNPLFSKLMSNLPNPVILRDETFIADGERIEEGDESFLLTYPHPLQPEKWVTIYFGQTPDSLSRARYIFFYGWDSYILFKKGRPDRRGNLPPLRSYVSYDFLLKDHLHKIQPQGLREHLSYLTSPELAGRLPETSGYSEAQNYLIKKLEDMGVSPILQPFAIRVKDIEKANLILKNSGKEKNLHAIPFHFSKEGEWKGPLAVKGYSGKAALILDFDPSRESLLEKIKEYQSKGAKAILIPVREEALDLLTPYITYPSYFPPKLEERLRAREKEGYYIHRSIEASKVASGAEEPDFSLSLPIFFIPYSQKEEGWVKDLLDDKDTAIEISLQFNERLLSDSNIGGIIYGDDPERKGEFLVLGAHYDHLGMDEKKKSYYPGADDNASGVAALLEIGRSLMMRRIDLRRSLIVLFFGGEEWGLKGSQHFLKNPFVPLAQIKAMFSLDAIGESTNEKEVFFVGGSFHPSLAQRSRRFLQKVGLKEGRDIDRYAFAFGSDHYPFHQRGIPSLDYFASDYKKLHTLGDNLEKIHFGHLTDVARLIYLTAYEFLTEP